MMYSPTAVWFIQILRDWFPGIGVCSVLSVRVLVVVKFLSNVYSMLTMFSYFFKIIVIKLMGSRCRGRRLAHNFQKILRNRFLDYIQNTVSHYQRNQYTWVLMPAKHRLQPIIIQWWGALNGFSNYLIIYILTLK